MKGNNNKEILRAVSAFTELGLNVVVSFLIWIFIASWIRNKFSLGNFIMVIGVFMGAVSAVLSFLRFCKALTLKEKDYEHEHKQ